jgi:CheY-like chemotaxis protein
MEHIKIAARNRVTPRSALVIDDDRLMLELIGDLLQDQGVGKVVRADSGQAALAVLDRSASSPDLIVCDLNMPSGDGFQVMEDLARRNYKGAVLLVSGMTQRFLNSAALMAKFHQLDILGTLAKPLQAQALAAALRGHHAPG